MRAAAREGQALGRLPFRRLACSSRGRSKKDSSRGLVDTSSLGNPVDDPTRRPKREDSKRWRVGLLCSGECVTSRRCTAPSRSRTTISPHGGHSVEPCQHGFSQKPNEYDVFRSTAHDMHWVEVIGGVGCLYDGGASHPHAATRSGAKACWDTTWPIVFCHTKQIRHRLVESDPISDHTRQDSDLARFGQKHPTLVDSERTLASIGSTSAEVVPHCVGSGRTLWHFGFRARYSAPSHQQNFPGRVKDLSKGGRGTSCGRFNGRSTTLSICSWPRRRI